MHPTPIRIGFITDLTGPYQGVDGLGGADAIRMAIEDVGSAVAGQRVELLLGDHRNDRQEAEAIARRWYSEEGVDMIISGVNSDTSLAMTAVAAEQAKLIFVVGAGTSVQTRERASPTIIQYAYNTVALSTAAGLVLTGEGGKRWFFVTADYPFGRELEAHGRAAIELAGGTVVGSVKNPHGIDDFTPFLQAARDSGAQVLGLANGHDALLKAMAAMKNLDLAGTMKLVGLLTFINDIHDIGLEKAQGLYLTDSWFWTRDTEARCWAERFYLRQQRMPSSLQAADYSAALQYLKAVEAVGGTESESVLQYLRKTKLNDMYMKDGCLREDGTILHDMYLLRAKTPKKSNESWDYYDLVATVSGNEAFPVQ